MGLLINRARRWPNTGQEDRTFEDQRRAPPEIQVIASADGVRYRLPRRPLTRDRLRFLIRGLVVSLLVIGGAAIWTNLRSGLGEIRSITFVFFWLLVACFMLIGFLSHIFGHSEVELRGGQLRAIERLGPFRSRRRISVDLVKRLVVENLGAHEGGPDPGTTSRSADEPRLAEIRAEARWGLPVRIAIGYPRAWLRALARDLALRVKSSAHDPLFDPPPAKIPVVEAGGLLARPMLPAGSDIVVDRHPDGVTFLVPPRGIARSGGYLLILVGVMFLAGAVLAVLQAAGLVRGLGEPGPAFAIGLSIGLLQVLWAIEKGRRRVELAVSGDMFRIKTTSPVRSRERVWWREEVADIRIGDSAREINDRQVPELQIHTRTGTKFGVLGGRDADELAFLAAAIRRSLDLPAKGDRLG